MLEDWPEMDSGIAPACPRCKGEGQLNTAIPATATIVATNGTHIKSEAGACRSASWRTATYSNGTID
jgi:hypothetical protein